MQLITSRRILKSARCQSDGSTRNRGHELTLVTCSGVHTPATFRGSEHRQNTTLCHCHKSTPTWCDIYQASSVLLLYTIHVLLICSCIKLFNHISAVNDGDSSITVTDNTESHAEGCTCEVRRALHAECDVEDSLIQLLRITSSSCYQPCNTLISRIAILPL